MKSQFYILLSLQTADGFVNYGQYDLGDDRGAAMELFSQLDGSPGFPKQNKLHIDLTETVNEMPVKISTVSCSLEELAANVKQITRALFRLKNLKHQHDGWLN
jgi:hypothetical protein